MIQLTDRERKHLPEEEEKCNRMIKYEDEPHTYFQCWKKDIPPLISKAKAEADKILKDFNIYFDCAQPVTIEIFPVDHLMFWSIGARLKFGDSVIKEDDCCDFLFQSLNSMILNQMLKLRNQS